MSEKRTEALILRLLWNHWKWHASWRGLRLQSIEKMYGVPPDETLAMMREIAIEFEPPDAEKLDNKPGHTRCKSCGMRIVWGQLNGNPHPLDGPVLSVITAEGQHIQGRRSHFGSCPKAREHRGK